MPRVIVIGGGPAGMMAAGHAAELGTEVILLEKTQSTGRKLRLTGAGRCNLTNTLTLDEFLPHIHGNGRFLRQALTQFTSSELITFVEELGVNTITEPNGRVYPASGRAVDIVNALNQWMYQSGVSVESESPVTRILVEHGRVIGVEAGRKTVKADAVVIACGGASYPETGSAGDGYRLAEAVGHSIVPIRPSIIPLEVPGDIPSRLQGLSLPDANVTLFADSKRLTAKRGEMLFTHFGVSGPAVLAVSRSAVEAMRDGKAVNLSLDFFADTEENDLDGLLLESIRSHGKRAISNILQRWLPSRLTPVITERCEVSGETPGNQLGTAERKRLVTVLKNIRVDISGHRPLSEAVVTAGGVNTREVDPRTMMSRLVKNLYFAGEVLDVDGDSGGFNLQIAFSTGWLAAESATQHPSDDAA